MKGYDCLVIIKANLTEEERDKALESFKGWLTKTEAELLEFNYWGVQDMPETFKPARQAAYFHCQFNGTNKTLDLLNEKMRVDESFLRHMIVRIESVQVPAVVEKAKA